EPARPCCQQAELAAMVETLAGPSDGATMTLRIPRNAVARKAVHLARIAGGRVEAVRKGPTEKRPTYRLRLQLPAGRGSSDPCCARAILRGAFLARGVLGNPADAYHLETANLDKRLRAALQQRAAVRRLKARDSRLHSLPPALRDVAELRLAHPRASLRELADVSQLSKSAIANRLRRLIALANRNGLID